MTNIPQTELTKQEQRQAYMQQLCNDCLLVAVDEYITRASMRKLIRLRKNIDAKITDPDRYKSRPADGPIEVALLAHMAQANSENHSQAVKRGIAAAKARKAESM